MKAIDVGCPEPSCLRRPGKHCAPPPMGDHHGDYSLYRKDGTRHDTLPGKPDDWKLFHKERSVKAAEMTREDRTRKANALTVVHRDQRLAVLARKPAPLNPLIGPNLFVNVRETWLIQELLERRAKQGAKSLPRGEAKRIQSLLAKVKAVYPVKG